MNSSDSIPEAERMETLLAKLESDLSSSHLNRHKEL